MSVFKGVATALITPFSEGKPDHAALRRLVKMQIDAGVDAVVALGTTGEPATMTKEEKIDVAQTVLDVAKGIIPVIIGAGGNDTAAAKKDAAFYEKMGADAILSVTPYYNKCTQNGLVLHYSAVANAINVPLIVYNVPSRTGVNVLPETFQKLSETDNVAAIKEASGNVAQIAKTIALSEGRADVYSGDDGLVVPLMALGAKGVVSVVSNVFPKEMKRLTSLCNKNRYDEARALAARLIPVVDALFSEVNPIPVKKAAEILGISGSSVRLPLTEMEKPHVELLAAAISDFLNKTC